MSTGMKERFGGEDGRRILIDALLEQRTLSGNTLLAEDIATHLEILNTVSGQRLIEQGDSGNDMYFILLGAFDVTINGKLVAQRNAGEHVGEMAAIQPTQLRSASITAIKDGVVGRLTEPNLVAIGKRHPEIWRFIAKELARRLIQRNCFIADAREKIRIFIISSAEALTIARAVQNSFEHDDFHVSLWTNDVFKASSYPIESLEAELDASDFAIAIAQPDDLVTTRGKEAATPRDNVIFELGFFMGRLGRQRALLLEPRGEAVKLPTDLSGITTITYKYTSGKDLASSISPACNKLRDIFNDLGPIN